MTPLQYRSVPLGHEVDGVNVRFFQGEWTPLSPTTGYITQANGKILSVQPDSSYQDRDAVGSWETFTIVPAGDILTVHVVESGVCDLTFKVPYHA